MKGKQGYRNGNEATDRQISYHRFLVEKAEGRRTRDKEYYSCKGRPRHTKAELSKAIKELIAQLQM